MDQTRDTHFAGFAKLLTQELVEQYMIVMQPRALEGARPYIEKLIAQRAYDLAWHVIDALKPSIYTNTFTPDNQDEVFKGIPDLSTWPE